MSQILNILLGVALMVAIGTMSNMVYDDLTQEERLYCEMVSLKAWPDYKKTYEKDCPEWLTHEQN